MMKTLIKTAASCGMTLALLAGPARAQFSVLHQFLEDGTEGRNPHYDAPTVSGSTLYGMTTYGGAGNNGVVFKMNTDGTGYTNLREFGGGGSDGQWPYGALTLSGSTLYGMTAYGGDSGLGTVFKMNTDGTGFSLLREFAGGVNDGSRPYGSLTLSGSTLYGMTYTGGDSDRGTVFKMDTDGTGFGLLREFAGGSADGDIPYGSLTLSGSTLYGMTLYGGASGRGTVFKMNTDGSSFSMLHEFAGGVSDGRFPYGSLTLDGSMLYGMTSRGGDGDYGTVFKLGTDGSGFSLLHEFAGLFSDGLNPYGSLTVSGSTLYGMTRYGTNAVGTLFQINTDGTGYSFLHQFEGAPGDGSEPHGSLTLSGLTLYGMTRNGGVTDGESPGSGTVFSYTLAVVPEPSAAALLMAGLGALGWKAQRRRSRWLNGAGRA